MTIFKHLNIDERYVIQRGMDEGKPFKMIGREISRDCKTISREVIARSFAVKSGGHGRCFNDCINRVWCTVTKLNPNCTKKKRCCFCAECCDSLCEDYAQEVCLELQKAPYCCNACEKRSRCTLTKMIYRAVPANKEYRINRSNANTGIYADGEEIERLNRIISPLIDNGQSLHQICLNHSDELMLSEKTLYSYVDKGLFDAKNIDMPRKVRYKPRKCNHASFKVDKKCRIGRTYLDMQRFEEDNENPAVVEMDSVIGRKGGKVFLTMYFTTSHLMLAYIRDANTASSVKAIFNDIYSSLGTDLFMTLFPMLRTDNGSEFTDPVSIEFAPDGDRRTWVFFCDAYASWQKPGCELNHEYIRRILPKGTSFDRLVQPDVQLMIDHINSYKRKSLGNKSPYEVFVAIYGQDAADKLGLTKIHPDLVILKPKLLKKKLR